MSAVVRLSKRANKELKYVPRHILVQFDLWIEIIENEGIAAMQMINGYRDHELVGNRLGQRSSSLSRSWRVIYCLDTEAKLLIVEVLEVNHHDY
jgi:addiction module RelE/StbE family toxin